jgi:branched-chain amino acid transport system permease protein
MNELLQQIFNGLAIGSVYTLVALGLTVVFGILGIAHFAHGSLAMFGGYLTFVFSTTMGLSLFASMALAMPVGCCDWECSLSAWHIDQYVMHLTSMPSSLLWD